VNLLSLSAIYLIYLSFFSLFNFKIYLTFDLLEVESYLKTQTNKQNQEILKCRTYFNNDLSFAFMEAL